MSANGASCIHGKPLVDTLGMKAVSAGTNACRTCHCLLTNCACLVCDSNVIFRGCENLLASRYDRDRVQKVAHKVPTWVQKRVEWNVHYNAFRMSCLCKVHTEEGICLTCVSHMRRHNVIASVSIQKPNHAKKSTVRLRQFANEVQHTVVFHIPFLRDDYENHCVRYK